MRNKLTFTRFISSKIGIATLLFLSTAAIAIAFVQRFREGPVAPTAPSSQPAASIISSQTCTMNFDVTPPDNQNCIVVNKKADLICEQNAPAANITLSFNAVCDPRTIRKPLDIVFAIDVSCSMDNISQNPPQPLTDAKAAAKQIFADLDPSMDRVSLVTFGSDGDVIRGLTNDFEGLKTTIDNLQMNCGTNTEDAIMHAQEELEVNGRTGIQKIMVVFTDGLADLNVAYDICEPEATTTTVCAQDAINRAATAKNAGTTIFTVALKNIVSPATFTQVEYLMKSIASSSSHYYVAEQATDLNGVFKSISESVTDILATSVVITDILPPNVQLIPDSSSIPPSSINGQTIMWNLGSAYVQQASNVTFKVKLLDTTTPNQLVDVYPDSRLTYVDHVGSNITLPFPETRISPQQVCLATSTPTNTLTVTPSNTNTPSLTPTRTNTPSPTFTNTPTRTSTPTPTFTSTPTRTNTPSPTLTNTPSPTRTNTPSPTNTFTLTPTRTSTPTATRTITPSFTLTATVTNTFTPSVTPTSPIAATCNWITMEYGSTTEPNRPPRLNESVTFVCGTITGATSYEFRVQAPGQTTYSQLATLTGSRSVPFTLSQYGVYKAQCRGCFNGACQEWE